MKLIIYFVLAILVIINLWLLNTLNINHAHEIKNSNFFIKALEYSNLNLKKKNEEHIRRLYNRAQIRPEEVLPYLLRAKKARAISSEFVKFIDSLKIKSSISKNVNGKKGAPFIRNEKKLISLINQTRSKLLYLLKDNNEVNIDRKDRETIISKCYLLTDTNLICIKADLDKINYDKPISLLTKFQNDCLNLESEILETLSAATEISRMVICRMEVRVVAYANAVLVGTIYKAEVTLLDAEYDKNYDVYVNGKLLPKQDGKGIYITKPLSPGIYHWGGLVRAKINNEVKEYPFEAEYQAFTCK